MLDLNALSKEIHGENARWWTDLESGQRIQRNRGELLCLIHSEVSEASEGYHADCMDDHLPARRMVEVEMADAAIRIHDYAGGFDYDLEVNQFAVDLGTNASRWFDSIHSNISRVMENERKDRHMNAQAELSALAYRIRKFCERFGYDLDGAITDKREYNRRRLDHKSQARKAVGGKKMVTALTIASFVVVFGGLILMLLLDRRAVQKDDAAQQAIENECREFWAKRAERIHTTG